MRKAPLLLAPSLLWLAACSSSTAGPDCECPAGEVCVDGNCKQLCANNTNCDAGSRCIEGICSTGGGGEPLIESVNGTGPNDADSTHVPNHIHDRLVITGSGLSASTVRLQGGVPAAQYDLELCDPESDDRMEVRLPPSMTQGDYVLTVTNQLGTCDATLRILQGVQGPQGDPAVAAQDVTCTGCVAAADVDSTTVQLRVAGTCVGGAIRSINANGTVDCEPTPTETDPEVGALAANRYCTSDGSTVDCQALQPGLSDGMGYFPPGSVLTAGIEGNIVECALTDNVTAGCNPADGWAVACRRSNAEWSTSGTEDGHSDFTTQAAWWNGSQWLGRGRGTGGPCTNGILQFVPVESAGKATPTNVRHCGRNDNGANCQMYSDGWPIICLRADTSPDYNRGGWMTQAAHFSGSEWRGVERGSGGPCTHGVFFWDYKN